MNRVMYNENLKVLKRSNRELYEKIKDFDFEIETTKELVKNNRDYNIYDKVEERYYYDENNPMESAVKNIESFGYKNEKIILFYGFGLGYEVIYYYYYKNKKRDKIMFIAEPDINMFCVSLSLYDFRDIIDDKSVFFIVGEDISNLDGLFMEIYANNLKNLLRNIKSIAIYNNQLSYKIHSDFYRKVYDAYYFASCQNFLLLGNSVEDALNGYIKLVENVENAIEEPGIYLFKDYFKDKVAVICSSGPSLIHEIENLKLIQDKAVIISAQSTFNTLVKNGVYPHIVTSLERDEETKDTFLLLDDQDMKKTFLCYVPCIPNAAVKAYKGKRIITPSFINNFSWLGIFKGNLEVGMSTGNMAFEVADHLGCNPIILVGQDLAFDRETGNSHHAGNFDGERRQKLYNQNLITVDANDGGKITTNYIWHKFLKNYVKDVALSKKNVINTAREGAFIAGTTYMSFEVIMQKYFATEGKITVLDDIDKVIEEYQRNVNLAEGKARIYEKFEEILTELKDIMDLAEEGKDSCINHSHELVHMFDLPEIPVEQVIKLIDMQDTIFKYKQKMFTKKFYITMLSQLISPYNEKFNAIVNDYPRKYGNENRGMIKILLEYEVWYQNIYEIAERALEITREGFDKLANWKDMR